MSPEIYILSVVTNDAAEELGLAPGRKALALIKSSFVGLAPADAGRRPERHAQPLPGVVRRRIDAERNSEVLVESAPARRSRVVPRQTAEDLSIAEGDKIVATFKPSDVILAVD